MSSDDIKIFKQTASYPEYETAKAQGLVESGVIPLCDALIGVKAFPLSSCEGHPVPLDARWFHRLPLFLTGSAHWSRPFVMFSASFPIANQIHESIVKSPALYFNWTVNGSFTSKGRFYWVIEPNDFRIDNGSSWVGKSLRKSQELVRNDLRVIAKGISQSVNAKDKKDD